MTKEERKAKMCTEKVPYKKEWEAKREARRSNMRHYKCPFCKLYHCGH